MDIEKELFKLQDKKYASFTQSLAPSVEKKNFIGVRVPLLRDFAKKMSNEQKEIFLDLLPHKYYDENLLHSILLTNEKDYEKCISLVEKFLPYIDNWAACDTLNPKVFNKHKKELIKKVKSWLKSKKTYTIRFATSCLMSYFLKEDYKKEYLYLPLNVKNDDYYVKMMIAWYYATAMIDHFDDVVEVLKSDNLDSFIFNKSISKAKESYRISKEKKEFLDRLKRENKLMI